MTFTYSATDLSTPLAQVRLLSGDTDSSYALFSDEEMVAFLALEGQIVKLAAAQALERAARDEARITKVIKLLDLQVDGVKVAAELRAAAAALRQQAREDVEGFSGLLDWAEQIPDAFSARERIWHELLRTGGA